MQNEQPEQTRIINIIFSMYNDNYRQITSLLNSNVRISDVLFQLLNRPQLANTNTNVNNSQARMINMLNIMYNDNIRQISSLNETNSKIRETYIQFSTPNVATPLPNEELRPATPIGTGTATRRAPETRARTRTRTGDDHILRRYSNLLNDFFEPSNLLNDFFEPINVFPTEEQINTAVRRVRYNDIISPTNTSCPISLEPFENNDRVSIINHCQHIFKTIHLNRWLRTNHRCPVCRYDIRTYQEQPTQPYNEELNNEELNNDSNEDDTPPDLVDPEPTTHATLSTSTRTRFSNAINSFINSNEQDLTDPVVIVRFLYNL